MAYRRRRGSLFVVIACVTAVVILSLLFVRRTESQPQAQVPTENTTIMIQQPSQVSPFTFENGGFLQNPPAQPIQWPLPSRELPPPTADTLNYPTRGLPQPYHQVGVLTGTDNGNTVRLPLLGRQTHAGSSKYHYYTSTDGPNPMKLPVNIDKRECSNSAGCNEVSDGTKVSVAGYNTEFDVVTYPSSNPLYVM